MVFCHISRRISHRYTHVPSLPKLPSISLPIPPFQLVTEALFEFPASHSKCALAVYFVYGDAYISMLLSPLVPHYPSPAVSTGLFSLCLHCALRLVSSVPSFQVPYIWVLIYSIFPLFLTYFTLYNRLQVDPPSQNRLKSFPFYR